jgi:hypothetical protein
MHLSDEKPRIVVPNPNRSNSHLYKKPVYSRRVKVLMIFNEDTGKYDVDEKDLSMLTTFYQVNA